ncbi:MAG: hypothetical protein LBD82_01810 [Deltaproteobacteria bacterium]|jgi:hypothetical protein|nr:hypothetical protein [Deltaproteobacteria bacterium]
MSENKNILYRLPAVAVLVPALAFSLCSCALSTDNKHRPPPLPVSSANLESGRPDPGYLQYLERQSMLSHASRLSQIVSGSNMNWRRPSARPIPEKLLLKGDVWLHIHPQNLRGSAQNPPLRRLGDPALWDTLRTAGISGLYIAPTGSGGDIWDNTRSESHVGDSGDIIQYTLPRSIGSEEDYAELLRQAEKRKILLGGDILPLAGGLGPDFFLSTRNFREYPGLYCMFELPDEYWPLLPPSSGSGEEWRVSPLTREQIQSLSDRRLIPERMRQDNLPYVPQSGWAATDEIRGQDGNLRRWVYRYAYNYKRPLLNLYDPSQTARKILNGSLIYQVGILGNALAGCQIAPLIGLDASGGAPTEIVGQSNYAASLGLVRELARQSRAYGGWTWLRDELPLPLLREAMQNGPDLVKDSVFSPAAEHALLVGKSFFLQFMLDEALKENIDFSRLVHASSGPYGIDYTMPHLRYMSGLAALEEERHMPDKDYPLAADGGRSIKDITSADLSGPGAWKTIQESEKSLDNNMAGIILGETLLQARSKVLPAAGGEIRGAFEGSTLYTTPAGLAALALGLSPDVRTDAAAQADIRRGHMLLQFFKIMQPGIVMFGGQDLVGAMPLSLQALTRLNPLKAWDKKLSSMGAYSLFKDKENAPTAGIGGIPETYSLYGPLDLQINDPESPLNALIEMLLLRRELSLDKGTLIGSLQSKGEGMIATVARLPGDGFNAAQAGPSPSYIIAISNFSRKSSEETLDLSRLPELASMAENARLTMLYGDMGDIYRHKDRLLFTAPGWSKALILVEKEAAPLNRARAPSR